MKPVLTPNHWAPFGADGYFVRFFALRGEHWPRHDHVALCGALGLRPERLGLGRWTHMGIRRRLAFNRLGEVHPVFLAAPAVAGMVFAAARSRAVPGIDEAEAAFAAAWHASLELMKEKEAA